MHPIAALFLGLGLGCLLTLTVVAIIMEKRDHNG